MGSTRQILARADAVNVAHSVERTAVEGPGWRYALWVQGCPLRCPGCCNPHLLEFKAAQWHSVEEVAGWINDAADIEGVTLIGGEPFAQATALAAVARAVQAAGRSVMVFSGFPIEQLRRGRFEGAQALLEACDILVDGPYIEAQASRRRRYIGSDNQRVHILSERYAGLAGEGWPRGDDGLEIRWKGDLLSINGYPHPELTRALSDGLRFFGPASSGETEKG